MLSRIAAIQRRLAEPVPQANEIGTLIDAYVEGGDVHLELTLAFARKEADVVGDEMRLERLRGFFNNESFRRALNFCMALICGHLFVAIWQHAVVEFG